MRTRRREGDVRGAVNRGGQDESVVVIHVFTEKIHASRGACNVRGRASKRLLKDVCDVFDDFHILIVTSYRGLTKRELF